MNIRDILEQTNPDTLNKIQERAKEEEKIQRAATENILKDQYNSELSFLEKHCFRSKEEMLAYLKNGNVIRPRYGYYHESLEYVNGEIKEIYMTYDMDYDMPTGYAYRMYSEEEFLTNGTFFHADEKYNGYDRGWIKYQF